MTSVYEYDSLIVGSTGYQEFTKCHLQVLEIFYHKSIIKYFNLIRNGIKFCNYVGVLQVGNLQIEILHKIDKSNYSFTT